MREARCAETCDTPASAPESAEREGGRRQSWSDRPHGDRIAFLHQRVELEELRSGSSATPLLEGHFAVPQMRERVEALVHVGLGGLRAMRSEERRVGGEGSGRWG